MKKVVILDPDVQIIFKKLDPFIQQKFLSYFRALREDGFLKYPDAAKVSDNLFEIRVRVKGAWRAFYAYLDKNKVIILDIFQKKQQKTPRKNIKLAVKRLNYYLQYDEKTNKPKI
jgi:phage-related protein